MDMREPVIAYGKTKHTMEEYLQWEKTQQEKHEYYRGEIFTMDGEERFMKAVDFGPKFSRTGMKKQQKNKEKSSLRRVK